MSRHATLGQKLRAARARKRKTQREIAQELEVSQPTVAGWEVDRVVPRAERLRRIAEVYGIAPAEVLPEGA